MAKQVSPQYQQFLDRGARALWRILKKAPAGKTGLSGELALKLNRKISPRDFDEILHHARNTLSAREGRAIVYDTLTDQYGFPENIMDGKVYVLSWNGSYLATRFQTMAIQARAVMAEHGEDEGLKTFASIAESTQAMLRMLCENQAQETAAWRAAHRSGVKAALKIEHETNGNGAPV